MPNLTVQAPPGAHFEYEEVKTARGSKSLGEVPMLVWDDLELTRANFGDDGILASLDGTSLRVSFQGIARRMRIAGKSDDEIAKAQIEFKPGKRAVGVSTPVSRAARAAKGAAEKVDGDLLAAFMARVAKGEISESDIASFVKAG